MATLRYSQIRATPGGTIHYIANKDKIISSKTHDVHNVLNYMGEAESTERIYTLSRHCSNNPDLAEKQMELYRQRYYASKGTEPEEGELLGLHFFMSYTEADNPSEAVMDEITMKILEHPLFRDFPAFAANHFDKDHRHTHFYVSQYAADGKPRKLCMRHNDYHEIRRYANRLCVEHGLSIVDLGVLRHKNPEYSSWIDGVIADGKVTVHPEKQEHKRFRKQQISTRNLYYKWKKDGEERAEEEYRLLTDRQRQKKNFESKYYYTPDGDKNKRWYVSGDPQHRFYVIPFVSEEGYRFSKLELTVRFVATVVRTEGQYIRQRDKELYDFIKSAKVDWDVQNMYNALVTAREMNIEDYRDVPAKIAEVGKQMNTLRREKSRHENSIKKHEKILEAYETYTRVRPLVEGVSEPKPADVSEYKAAYAILAQNQILSAQAFAELHARYQFEKRKVSDYEKRMPELNKQYRDLKKLEAISSRPTGILHEVYGYSRMADERASERAAARHDGTVESIINNAKERSQPSGNDKPKGYEREY